MNDQWRLLLAAWRFLRWPRSLPDDSRKALPHQATRYVPLIGIAVGLCAAAVYWSASQLWPTSVGVVLAMLAMSLIDARSAEFGPLYWIFLLLLKYNALIALSAANIPLPLPPYLTLGLIMTAGQAASRGLMVSAMAMDSKHTHVGTNDLSVALLLGFAPATLLGIPGLIGLATVIVVRIFIGQFILDTPRLDFRERLGITQHVTEVGFYLGALATWIYI